MSDNEPPSSDGRVEKRSAFHHHPVMHPHQVNRGKSRGIGNTMSDSASLIQPTIYTLRVYVFTCLRVYVFTLPPYELRHALYLLQSPLPLPLSAICFTSSFVKPAASLTIFSMSLAFIFFDASITLLNLDITPLTPPLNFSA